MTPSETLQEFIDRTLCGVRRTRPAISTLLGPPFIELSWVISPYVPQALGARIYTDEQCRTVMRVEQSDSQT